MRERRAGTIVNISSVVGRFAALAQAPYVASKWALEGMSECLAQELAPWGIRVAVVEPGITRSAIFAKSADMPATAHYGDHYARMFEMYAAGLLSATDPFEVAAVVRDAAETNEPQLRYRVSWGSEQLITGRDRLSDEAWLQLGRAVSDPEAYASKFEDAFALDIRPGQSGTK